MRAYRPAVAVSGGGGMSAWVEGVSAWGCLPRGLYTPWIRDRHHPWIQRQTPPPDPVADSPLPLVNRMIDRCKNIIFPQLKVCLHVYIAGQNVFQTHSVC